MLMVINKINIFCISKKCAGAMLLLKHLQIMGKILMKMYLAIVWEESSMVWTALSLWPREREAGDKELPCGRVVAALLVQPSGPRSAH
jgi:hypothetical protein